MIQNKIIELSYKAFILINHLLFKDANSNFFNNTAIYWIIHIQLEEFTIIHFGNGSKKFYIFNYVNQIIVI